MMEDSETQATKSIADQVGVGPERASELMAAQEGLKKVDVSLDPGFVEIMPTYTPEALEVKYLSTSPEAKAVLAQFNEMQDVSVQFVQVPFALEELGRQGIAARQSLPVPADSTLSPEDGTVVLTTATAVDPEQAKQVEAVASPVGIEWRIGKLAVPSTGGGGAMSTCTGGFTVRIPGSTRGIATAGHCDNSQNYTGPVVSNAAGGEAYSGNADVQWMVNSVINFDASVWTGGPSNWPVQVRKDWNNAGLNDSVCRYGKMTGSTCGVLTDKWFAPSYVPSAAFAFGVMTGTTSIGGDSGGPVYYGTTAWGIHSGSTGGGANIFTPQDRLTTRLGIQVMIQ